MSDLFVTDTNDSQTFVDFTFGAVDKMKANTVIMMGNYSEYP